mgnify:CR=1 FL=1
MEAGIAACREVISIPIGAVKSCGTTFVNSFISEFQFQSVRLKVVQQIAVYM